MTFIKVDQLKDVSFLSPAENILYDDVLLNLAQQGKIGNTLRLWESPGYFIVLGRTGKAQEDVQWKTVEKDAVPVLRRSSGGGTVVQGPGCLNFTFILSKEVNPELCDLRHSYRFILQGVLDLLKNLGVAAVFRPISDLALESSEKKFSGNAQYRGRNFILHHGTILYDFDLSLIARYLNMPEEIPEYRKGRGHNDFVVNIPASRVDLVREFQRVYGFSEKNTFLKTTIDEQNLLGQFLAGRALIVKH